MAESAGNDTSGGILNKIKSVGSALSEVGNSLNSVVKVSLDNVTTGFDEKMNKVSTLADTNIRSMNNLVSGVLDVSNETGESADVLADKLYKVLSITKDTGSSLDYLKIASKLSKLGFEDIGIAVEGLNSIMGSYGIKGKENLENVADLMFQTKSLGKIDSKELTQSLNSVVPTAAGLGVNFNQVATAMGTITSQGVPASTAAAQLKKIFMELSNTSSIASQQFKNISGKNFTEFIKGGASVQDALKIMEKGAKQNGLALKDMFSSIESKNAVMKLTGDDAKKFAQDLKQMGGSSGLVDREFNKMNKSVKSSVDNLNNSFKNIKISLGQSMQPIVSSLVQTLKRLLDSFNNLPEPIKRFIANLLVAVGFIEKTASSLSNFCNNIVKVVERFKALNNVVGIFSKIGALITLKAVLIVGAIAAIGLIVYEVIKHWDSLKKAAQNLWESISGVCKKIGDFFSKSIEGWKLVWNDFKGFMSQIGSWITDGLLNGLKKGWEKVKEFPKKMGNGIKDEFKSILGINSPSRVFAEYGGFIGEGLIKGLDKQEGAINSKFKGLGNKIKELGNIKPEFAALNNIALSGAYGGSSGFNNISNSSNRQLNFNPTINMHISIADTGAKGTEQLTQELKGMSETALKNSMVNLFMNDAIRN